MKILIASIGRGKYDKASGTYRYESCKYRYGSTDAESAYIPFALQTFQRYDKLILLGTAGSGWANFYEYITDPENHADKEHPDRPIPDRIKTVKRDEKYLEKLRAFDKIENHMADGIAETEELLQKLKECVCNKYILDICILRYGTTEEEMQENLERLQKLSGIIGENDAVTFDITHSFRSLPFYELFALNYCRDVLGRSITFDNITYGMLECRNENGGVVPVVSLKPILTMSDCIKAADEFRRSGTVNRLLAMMEEQKRSGRLPNFDNSDRRALKWFNETAFSVIPEKFDKMLEHCHETVREPDDGRKPGLRLLIDTVLRVIDENFYPVRDDAFLLRCRLASWHMQHEREAAAALYLAETYLDYCSRLCGYDISDFENNLKFRAAFNQAFIPKNTAPDALDFRDAYKELYKIRNRFAHPSGDGISSSDRDAMKRLIIRTEKDYRAMQEKPEQLEIFAEAVRKNLPENEDL